MARGALHNVLTGEKFSCGTMLERQERRIARMRHVVWMAVHSIADEKEAVGGSLAMYTLTYKGVKDWAPRHVSGFCRWLRAHQVKSYVWVAELQRRGAVHYHALALLPHGTRWVKPNADSGGWARGFTWVTPDVRFPWYILKYMQKGSKDGRAQCFPLHLRLYGVSQWTVRRLSYEHSVLYRASMLPAWFKGGEISDSDIRCCYRVAGGVSFGEWKAVSTWSESGLDSIDQVALKMYACVGSSPN